MKTGPCSAKVLLRATTCLLLTSGIGISPAFAVADLANTVRTERMQQQKVSVSGVVKDKNGEPIIGASIMEKGTTNGTISDIDGKYTLNVKSPKSVLVISYLGLKTQEVTIGSNRKVNVILQDDSELMDEVVVIGYGTQRKGDVTSAVASVKAEDFTIGKIGDAAELIKGKVAGLSITNSTGDPTKNFKHYASWYIHYYRQCHSISFSRWSRRLSDNCCPRKYCIYRCFKKMRRQQLFMVRAVQMA